MAIINQIDDFINWISAKLKEAKYKLSKETAKQINERALGFCENFVEVLSECQNENVRDIIYLHLQEMLKQFEVAEKYSSKFTESKDCKFR